MPSRANFLTTVPSKKECKTQWRIQGGGQFGTSAPFKRLWSPL